MTDDFQPLGSSDKLPNDYVVPYYLDDRKHRVSVARVAWPALRLRRSLPPRRLAALSRTAHRYHDHVSVRRLAVRPHDRSGHQRPATEALGTYEVREVDGVIQARI